MSDIQYKLLKKLLASKGVYVSGGQLSESLDVSRVSIKNHVDQLVSAGYEIKAVRNRGYCLEKEPECFHQLGFLLHCEEHLPTSHVHTYDEIDSTSTEVDRLLNNGATAPLVVIASKQTAGKGRRGNKWMSCSGENLYMSLGFRPDIETARIGQYTLWMGICLAEFLKNETGLDFKVKWPNDLYVEGRKLAGILSEAKIDTDHVQHLIVGLGLNINGGLRMFPDDLKGRASSLKLETGQSVSFNRLASVIARLIVEQSELYFSESLQEEIQKKWDNFDFLKGRKVVAKRVKNSIIGIANGIDEKGQLLIQLDNGEQYTVHSGEVTMAFE